ncbi:MAG: thioredoxin family protein [Candidatus Zixiibacteriota bacterium]
MNKGGRTAKLLELTLFVTFLSLTTSGLLAQEAKTFDDAKTVSVRTGKPVLLEFNRDDCEYCQEAKKDQQSVPAIKAALDKVVHISLSVLQGEGTQLSETYKVGIYYPVFVLMNAEGKVISRWTGYTGADRFIASFNQAMADRTTVDERIARFRKAPTVADAFFLAEYFTQTQEYLTAREYVRELQLLQGQGLDLSFRYFSVTAEAVWNSLLPFDSLVIAADAVLAKKSSNTANLGMLAQMMGNVARRTGHTNRLEKYLMAGMEATANRKDKDGIDLHRDLLADYALHVFRDSAEAISVRKQSMGDGWEKDPARYFQFGEWCLRRNINLGEAEYYVRLATKQATGDKFRASHLRLLAEICYARGNTSEAVRLANESLALDPTAVWFEKKLDDWRAGR